MNKIESIKKNIDILLIAIEALDIYALDNIETDIDIKNLQKNPLFSIRSGNQHRKIYIADRCYFTDFLVLIYKIQSIASKQHFQSIITTILIDYSYNYKKLENSSAITRQYLRKFNYTYYKIIDLYINSHKHNRQTINMDYVAITTLYILSKLHLKHGTVILLKYLEADYNIPKSCKIK